MMITDVPAHKNCEISQMDSYRSNVRPRDLETYEKNWEILRKDLNANGNCNHVYLLFIRDKSVRTSREILQLLWLDNINLKIRFQTQVHRRRDAEAFSDTRRENLRGKSAIVPFDDLSVLFSSIWDMTSTSSSEFARNVLCHFSVVDRRYLSQRDAEAVFSEYV
jgi:hypothetical protein